VLPVDEQVSCPDSPVLGRESYECFGIFEGLPFGLSPTRTPEGRIELQVAGPGIWRAVEVPVLLL